jgi:hypothetical protein
MGWSDWIPKWLQRPAPAVPPAPLLGALTVDQYLMGRDNDQRYQAECTPAVRANAAELVRRVNLLLGKYGHTPAVNSGWRPAAINRSVGGAKGSAHLTGQAVDLADRDQALQTWCLENIAELEAAGLWCEDFAYTKTWVHWQSRPAANRIFKP